MQALAQTGKKKGDEWQRYSFSSLPFRRGPGHKHRREHDLLVAGTAVNPLKQQLRRLFPEQRRIDIHNGQLRLRIFRQRIIIKRHNADLLRHCDLLFLAGLQQPKGCQIIVADERIRVRLLLKLRQRRSIGIFHSAIRCEYMLLSLVDRLHIATDTALGEAAFLIAAQVGDAAVSLFLQVTHSNLCTLFVVVVHPAGVAAQRVRCAQHDIRKVTNRLHHGGAHRRRRKNQSIHLMLLHQIFNRAAMALRAVGNHDLISSCLCHLLNGKQTAAKKHVAECISVTRIHHHANRPAQPAGQTARQGVGMVIQRLHRGVDALLGIRRDGCLAIDHAGNCRGIDPRQLRHIMDGHRHAVHLAFPCNRLHNQIILARNRIVNSVLQNIQAASLNIFGC